MSDLPLPVAIELERPESERSDGSAASKHASIGAYAIEMAGSSFDLDRDLEAAAVEHLLTLR